MATSKSKLKPKPTFEECFASALPFETRTAWRLAKARDYKEAAEQGWRDDCCSHMVIKVPVRIKPLQVPPTFEECKASALLCQSGTEWQKNDYRAYREAGIQNWRAELCEHMPLWVNPNPKQNFKPTFAECKSTAAQCQYVTHWKRKFHFHHKEAELQGWLPDCCGHMMSRKSKKTISSK